ncbi:glycosyltransferase family 39 protein [Candidatus Babeliales bacterium]|nr:glycosyltransferase family 39 protein [Candidatus Babeliales bacterium]
MSINKKTIITLILFLGIIIIFGIPFTTWWFNGDDFHGLFLAYKTTTWHDLLNFFYEGHTNVGIGPSNAVGTLERSTFLGTYYRPLYCIFLTLQYWLFGTNAYPYFLCNIVFHAFNTALLFIIFSKLTGLFPALLAALLFAAHPQIAYRFGAIVNFHYYVNVALVLLTLLAFKKYLDTNYQRYNALACTLFALSLFTRESSIVLPGIAFIGAYLYLYPYEELSVIHHLKNFPTMLSKVAGLAGTGVTFLILRLYLYPFTPLPPSSSNTSWLLKKIPELKVFIFDLFSLSWLPWGQPVLRGTLLLACISFFAWLFFHNTRKRYVFGAFLCGLLMLWPALAGPYSPRYFYESYPFFLLSFILCCIFYTGKLTKFKKSLLTLLSCFVIFNIFFVLHSFARRTTKHHQLAQATHKLVTNPAIKNRALCFVGHPLDGFGEQNAAIFWILLNDPTIPIFFDSATAIMQADANIVQPTKWANIVSAYHDKNYYTTTPVSGGFRFTSTDPEKVYFLAEHVGYSLGTTIIHEKKIINGQNIVTDFTLLLDEQYIKKSPIFIRWDFETKKFLLINHDRAIPEMS